ncbi:MAG: hypothetical protein AB7R40_26235 [Nitrospiraceae bacterium]
MPHLPPFERFQEKLTITTLRGVPTGAVPMDDLQRMLRASLRHVVVDERWYLKRYPDVATAIRNRVFASGRAHFVAEGYFEGRRPFAIEVDEKWYLEQNPEVAAAVEAGAFKSAQQHFDENGYREGRLPCPDLD